MDIKDFFKYTQLLLFAVIILIIILVTGRERWLAIKPLVALQVVKDFTFFNNKTTKCLHK